MSKLSTWLLRFRKTAAYLDEVKLMSQTKRTRQVTTLTSVARHYSSGLTTRVGQGLWALGIHPDLVTLVGLALVAAAAYAASQGEFFWAAVIMLIGTPLDAVDGAVARAMHRDDKFGALWDSTLDRYSDGFIFMGLAVYYSGKGDQTAVLLAMLALLGSLMVSYVRARAGGLKVDCEVGLFTRMERIVIIMVMLALGWVKLGLWVLAIGTHLTVAHRVWHVHRTLNGGERR